MPQSFIYGYHANVRRELGGSVEGFAIELCNILFYGISTGFVYHNTPRRFWVICVDKSRRIAIEQNVTGLMQFIMYGSKTCASMYLIAILN